MPKSLTEITLKKLQPPEAGQKIYWDSLTGFGVRVSQGGAKTFLVVHGRDRRKTTIGRYPIISLSEARTAARNILAERTLRKHSLPSIRFEDALQQFFTTHVEQNNRPSTQKSTKRLLNVHFLPKLRHHKLEDINHHDISQIVDGLLSTPSEANHAQTAIATFFRWCVRRHYLLHSPCEGMQLRRRKPRDRVLTDDEIRALWHAADEDSFGQILKLLILTGQRRGEIAALRADYLTGDTITLPASLTKNRREHTFPIGKMAQEVLPTRKGYLFLARGTDHPFNGFSKCKAAVDRRAMIAAYTLHDLRRTYASGLARLGVLPHIIERLLNHATGQISGVAATYNRYLYLPEMRGAVQKWEAHLATLTKAD